MNTPLYTFEPLKSGLDGYFYLAVATTFILLLFTIFLQKKEVKYENRNLRNLGVMMSLFGVFIAISVIIFSWFYNNRIGTVKIYDQQIDTSQKLVNFKDVKRIYLKETKQSSHISPQIIVDTTMMLVIEEMGGKTHLFTDEFYPIKEMVVKMNEAEKASR